MKDKAVRPTDIKIKPQRGPTETRGLQDLPSILLSQVQAEQGTQTQHVQTNQCSGQADGGADDQSGSTQNSGGGQ